MELKTLGVRRPRITPYATLYTQYYFNTIGIYFVFVGTSLKSSKMDYYYYYYYYYYCC